MAVGYVGNFYKVAIVADATVNLVVCQAFFSCLRILGYEGSEQTYLAYMYT